MKNQEIELSRAVAQKVLKVVDAGLVCGLGEPTPGKMCVEAAVSYALGLPHNDKPQCVGMQVREFKIALNDSLWPTNEDRTKGMRKLAIAQLGSDTLNQEEFLQKLGFRCITTILPLILENSIKKDKDNAFAKKHLDFKAVEKAIVDLKLANNFKEAKISAGNAWKIYSASASASASAYAYAYASASASASAYAYAYAYASASVNKVFSLKILNLTAQAGLDTLIEMKSPGCEWLDLCE